MEKIDVVVVGAGLAGLSCAYKLAAEGLQVIVVERGDFPGSKNVTGGRLYPMPVKSLSVICLMALLSREKLSASGGVFLEKKIRLTLILRGTD